MPQTIWISAFMFLCADSAMSQGVWNQVADFADGDRASAVGFTIGNRGYICAGSNSTQFLRDLWEYDPDSNTWTQRASLPTGNRSVPTAFVIGSKAYVGTGYGTGIQYYSDFWEWDQATDTWSQIADYPGEGGVGLGSCIAFSVGDKGYVGTGGGAATGFIYSDEIWEYDTAADSWAQKASLPGGPRWRAVGFSLNGKGYVGTGEGEDSTYDDFWQYDPQTDSWTQMADFGGGERRLAAGFAIGDYGYIGTGIVPPYNDFWKWNSSTDQWTPVTNYPGGGSAGIRNGCAFSIEGKGYVGLGIAPSAGYQFDFWKFYPDSISAVQPRQSLSLSLYPSPTTGPVTINLPESLTSSGQLTITNSLGQTVQQHKVAAGTIHHQLDLTGYPSGLYVLTLSDGVSIRQGKVMKQ